MIPQKQIIRPKRIIRPDFLAIGHVTRDLIDNGHRLGGTVTYASLTAIKLGLRVAIVTAAAPEINLQDALPGIELAVVPSPQTTTFRNLDTIPGRIQYLLALAGRIAASAIPQEWRRAPLVLLAPVVHELDESLLDLFPTSFIGLTPQGWLRSWDDAGRVFPRNWPQAEVAIPKAGAVMVSEEDLYGEAAALLPILEKARLAIITRGAKGTSLYLRGQRWDLPPRPAQSLDPTGAGDVLAAAFMVKYAETQDPVLSTQFGQVAASFSIEAPGLAGIPDRAQVEGWLKDHASDLGLG